MADPSPTSNGPCSMSGTGSPPRYVRCQVREGQKTDMLSRLAQAGKLQQLEWSLFEVMVGASQSLYRTV